MMLKKARLEIPWRRYDEDEVQGILFQYLISMNYEVDWYHRDDKTMEKKAGCDLLCRKPGETIGIAVKKRPRAEDIDQMKKLARKRYSRRVYVNVEDPTPEFMEAARNYRGKIEFWDPEYIEGMLEKNDVGLAILYNIIFSNSDFLSEIIDIVQFTKAWLEEQNQKAKSRGENKKEEQAQPLGELMRLKDEAVFLHKSDTLLLGILEDSTVTKGIDSKALFALFLYTIEYYGLALRSFLQTWQDLHAKNPMILHKVYNIYGHKSPWKNFWPYEYWSKKCLFYKPGVMKKNLEVIPKIDTKEHEEIEDKFVENFKKAGKEYERVPFITEVIREFFFRKQVTFFLCLEDIVDMMLEI